MKKMKKINMGNSGIEASEIGIGCMRMAGIEKSEAEKVIKTALEEEINFFELHKRSTNLTQVGV